MDRPNLEQMLARAEAATEGPWEDDDECGERIVVSASIPFGRPRVVLRPKHFTTDANKAFVLASRTDLPAAVLYAMELEREVAQAHAELEETDRASGGPCTCPTCTAVRAREAE